MGTQVIRFSYDDLVRLNAESPCVGDCRETWIVTRIAAFDFGEYVYEVREVRDVAAFASEKEAREYVAETTLHGDIADGRWVYSYSISSFPFFG